MPFTDSENSRAANDAVKAALWKPLAVIVAGFGIVNIAVLLVLWPNLADKAEKRATVEAHAAAKKATENYVSQRLTGFDQMTKQAAVDAEGLRKTFGELQHTLGQLETDMKYRERQMQDSASSHEAQLKGIQALAAAVEAEYRTMDRTAMAGLMRSLEARTHELEQQFEVLERGVPAQQLREIAEKLRGEKVAGAPPAVPPAKPTGTVNKDAQPGAVSPSP